MVIHTFRNRTISVISQLMQFAVVNTNFHKRNCDRIRTKTKFLGLVILVLLLPVPVEVLGFLPEISKSRPEATRPNLRAEEPQPQSPFRSFVPSHEIVRIFTQVLG